MTETEWIRPVDFGVTIYSFRCRGNTTSQTIHDQAHIGGMLYARFENETIGALDYRTEERCLHIDMIFVKPAFRNRGVASAFVDCLLDRYPDQSLSEACCRLCAEDKERKRRREQKGESS